MPSVSVAGWRSPAVPPKAGADPGGSESRQTGRRGVGFWLEVDTGPGFSFPLSHSLTSLPSLLLFFTFHQPLCPSLLFLFPSFSLFLLTHCFLSHHLLHSLQHFAEHLLFMHHQARPSSGSWDEPAPLSNLPLREEEFDKYQKVPGRKKW